MRPHFISFLFAGLCLLLGLSGPAGAQDSRELTQFLSFAPAAGQTPAEMQALFDEGGFSPTLELKTLSTNYAPEAWAAARVFGASNQGEQVIAVDLPLVSEVDLYLMRNGQDPVPILSYSLFRPFDGARHAATRLRSEPFRLDPEETALVLAHVKFGPFQSLRMTAESLETLESRTVRDAVGLTAFYAASLACLAFFLVFFVAMRDWISLLFALVFVTGLAFIAFIDGLLFRFVYPARPDLQSVIGFCLLFGLSGSGFGLGAYGFWRAGRRRLAWGSLALLGLAAIGLGAAIWSPGPYAALGAQGLLVLSLALIPVSTGMWRGATGPTHAVAISLVLAAISAFALATLTVASGWPQGPLPVMTMIRGTYLVLLVGTLANMAAHVILLRRDHRLAVAARLKALEAEAALSQDLLEAERNYARARDLARQRQRQLATASHDLKQPLTSLRMTFDSLGPQMDPGLRGRLSEAFDYIEQLSGEYLRDTAPQADPPPVEETEPYALGLILQTVQQMFHQDALSKGLRLNHVDSSAMVQVPPLVLMRITSNLVSNAVNHTEKGRVLMGARRRAGRVELWICDTGPGMTPDQIATFRQEGQKGDSSDGHGLGLAVCFGLAAEHDLTLMPVSAPGKGTVFRLFLPLA